METSSTYPKFSFLRFFYTLVLVPLLLVSPGLVGEVMGQTKVLADEVTYSSPNVPANLVELALGGNSQETVEAAPNAVDGDAATFARLNASPGLLLGLGAFGGTIELKFPGTANLPGGTTTYIKLNASDGLLAALLGGSLGDLLGDVVSSVALGAHVFDVEARNSSDAVVYSTTSSNQFAGTNARIVTGADGSIYLAITPSAPYQKIRISNETTALLGLDILTDPKTLDIYEAFYVTGYDDCDQPLVTAFDGTGIGLTALALQEQNLGNAIDDDPESYSVLKQSSLLDVNAGGSLSQYFYLPTVSPATSTFNIKISLAAGSGVLNADLLDGVELIAWNGSQAVYRRSLAGGLLNGVDILDLLESGDPATLTFAPGREFDRIEVRLNSPIGLSLAGSAIHIYDVERFDEVNCTNPLVTRPLATDGPFEAPSCASTLLDNFENVNFAQNAVDGNNETFATLFANNGSLLGSPAADGMIEMELPETLPAFKTSYVRINFDEEVLDRLVGGSLGKLVADLGGLVLGNHFFDVEARNGTTTVLERSSSDAFENPTTDDDGVITLVQDNIGRYYLAITPSSPYNRVRITNRVSSLLPTGETRTMDVYNLCYETGLDRCFPANFTSYEGGGLNLGVAIGNEAGVTNPYRAISSNSSEYSEISLGTAGVIANVFQTIYFSQPSEVGDMVRIRLQTEPSSALSLDVIGQYRVEFYNGSELVDSYTMQQGLINNIDLLALFNSGGIINLEYVPEGVFDRVKVGIQSTAALGVATPPMRLYNVKRISDDCPEIETPSPFDSPVCADLLIAAENADDIDNLFDTDFDSFATLNSGAGTLLGLGGQYEGFVELGYNHTVPAGTTSYIRIDFDEDILTGLLGGSLGNVVTGLLNGLVLGDHFFQVEVKNNTYDGNGLVVTSDVVDEAISNDASAGGNNSIRIVRDKEGRFYIAVTPTGDYNAVRITDHTNSALGLLAQPNTMNVYGMCYEGSNDECLAPFATSYEFSGLGLTVNDLSGAGVTNPHYAINDNTTQASEISMGTLNITGGAKQWIFFNTTSVADDVVEITFSTGAGGVDVDLLGDLEIKAYLGETEVATLDWQNGIINGINVINLINNGETITVPFSPGQPFDRISVGISSVLNASVFPPVLLYSVERCATLANADYETWKSFEVDGDLALTSVSGGEVVEYTIHLRNTGTVDLSDFIITDEIPEHTTLVAASISAGGTESGGTITWEGVDVPVGGETTVSFSVTVNKNLTGVTEISNVALVRAYETDPGTETVPPADHNDPDGGPDPTATPGTPTVIPVDPIHSVVSWKAYKVDGDASITSVSGGEEIEYTIYVRNTGNQNLTNVVVSDLLPDGVTYVSGGTLTGNTVSFNVGSLEVGATSIGRSFTVKVDEDLTGVDVVRNVAVVSGDDLPPAESYPPVDNETPGEPDDTGDTGTEIPVTPLHDINISLNGLTSGGNTGPAVTGEVITYTVTVENTGNKDLTGVELNALVPDHTTFNGSTDGGTASGTTVTFPDFDLGVGEILTFTYDVDVDAIDPSFVTSIDNTATVTFRNEDDTADETRTADHTMNTSCITLDITDISLSSDDEICEGGSITLNASLTGGPIADAQFLWFTNSALTGTPLVGDAVTVSPGVNTTYYVIVDAAGYCFDTPPAEVTITVNPLPSVPTIGYTGDLEICAGESLVLTATATGAASYAWYKDGVLQGETSATFAATESGVYTVAAENAAGCPSAVSAPVTVVVTPRASSSDLTVDGNGGPVCEGSSVSLTASSTTITNPVFNWYSDAALTQLVFTGATLTINPAEDITLYVTVQGDGVCETAPVDAEVVNVVVNPTPDFTVDGSLNFSIEVGNSVELPTITAPTATVTWYDNDGNEHADPAITETFDTPGTYTYTAVITEADHCTVTVSVVINVYAAGECPPVYNRVYATDASDYGVSRLLLLTLGSIDNPANAADGDIDTYSELTEGVNALGLLGQTYQTLKWSTTVDAGTPVSVKLGKQFSTVSVLGSLRIVAVDASGNAVSTVHNVEPNILNALGGLNVYDYTFTPADGSGQPVAYAGLKVYYQGAVSLLQTARIYEAYYHEVGAVDCGDDEVLDVLHGVENPISGLGVANALIGVADPEHVVDEDPATFATMNNLAAVNAQTRLEVRYNTPSLAGDEVHIQLSDPGNLLVVGALESFTIQPYLGDAPVGDPIDETSSILRIELLSGGSEAEVVYTADRPFDRVKILYGGVAGVLDQLQVNEITRVVPQLELGDNGDNKFEICEGGDIVIPEPDNCTSYLIYDLATGGTVVDITALPAGVHTFYVQTVRFGACEVGERTEIEITVNALPVAPVVNDREVCQSPVSGDELYDVTALPDHMLNYYATATATTPLSDVPVVNSAVPGVYTVYVSQVSTDTGCEGPRAAVTIEVVETVPPALTELEQTFCEIEMATVGDLNTAGATGTVNWYAADGTTLTGTELLVSGSYYAAQVVDGCESVDRTEVTVTVTIIPAPTLDELEQTFCEIDMPTVADLNRAGGATGTVIWYTAATGGTPLADTEVLVDGTYYAAQVVGGCESVNRTEVEVTITKTLPPVLTNLDQIFCEIDMPTVADLNTDGATGTVIWYTAATGGTPLSATDALVDGTYFAAQIGDNCESVDRTEVEVTITKTPAPTLTNLDQIFCEIDMPTVANLNTDGATGTVVWYTAATGGTPLSATDALVDGTYFAAQIGDNCESVDRTEVEVTITKTPAPTLTNLDQIFCEIDMPTVADLNTDGATGTVVWYTAATGGTPLSATDALVDGMYYAAQVGDNCESVNRTEVEVTITKTPAPTLTNLDQIFCEIDMPTVADLNTDGATGDVVWYTAATGGTALADDAALTAGTYYAAQIGDNCESVDRTEVEVTITKTPAPTLTNLDQIFCEIDMPTVADLNTDGATGTVVWYTAATGGTPLSATDALVDGMYYAAQIGNNCESVDRTEVEVTITKTPAPILTNLEQTFCEIDMPTVANLNTDGATGTVVWYTAATGGTPLADTDALVDGMYYAAQVGDNCESVDRTEVEVTITKTPAPTLTNLDQIFCEIDMPTVADLNTDGATGTVVWYGAATGGTPLAADAALTAGTYYAAQIGDNCESVDRTAVTVIITETPAPALTKLEYELCESDGLTVADLSADGATGTVVWYTSATGGTALAADVALTTGTYYAAQIGDNCESVDRTAVTVVVSDCTSLLSITKTADADRATAGESISFTLTITNEGPGAMHSGDVIKLGERPSDGLTITGYEVTSGNGTASGTGNAATVTTNAMIPVGGTITLTVTADVDADAPATVTNGIDVWGPDKDPETDPKDDEDDTPPIPVDRESNLSITKVADQARVKAGESTSFTLTITNDGPSVIEVGKDINLTERPGEGVTITGYEVASGAATVTGNNNTATLTTTGKIALGGTIVVKVTADVAANAGETITNGITVWGPDKDPETDPEDDEDDTPPIPVDHDATLSITKVADEARVQAGASTSFTLTITNNGPAVVASGEVISLNERPGTGVTITGYEVTSGNGTAAGSGNTATVTTSEAVAVGGTIVVKVTADVAANAGETITNGIDVWGPDKDPETDPKDDEDDTPPIPVDHVSVLSITKVADDERVIVGGTTSFTVTVTNNGPATIAVGETIAVEERPSDGLTVTGYEVTSGNATVSGTGNSPQLTTTAAINVGGTITFTVSADVTASAGSTISNDIAVWGPDKDPGTDPEDDEDETPEIPVDRPYTLGIEKVADQSLVTAGESTTFTITVTNNGPLEIQSGETIALRERPGAGVSITGYEIISGAATVSGTGNTATLTTTGVVGAGATITVRITADVAETATGTITNGISVWGPDGNPDTDEPDDEDDIDPIPVDATLHIPNVFTPNGDGLNDRFVIKNLLQYRGRELIVVNRWGNQVYKSDNYNNDWDGGSLAEGTYYYILRYRNGGDWKTAKGPVAIVRITNR